MKFNDEEEIKAIIKANTQAPKWVQDAREYHKELKQLVLGDDFVDLLLKVEDLESDKRAAARKKYSRSIQDVSERLLNLIDNVYTATGGTKVYNIKSTDKKKTLMQAVTRNRDNRSLENWLRTFWSRGLYIVDPAGIVFLEYSVVEGIKPSPTYKSINSIRSYKAKGQNLDWLLFEPVLMPKTNTQEEHQLIRFVDDEKDYTFRLDGDNCTLVEALTFSHPFGAVPGLINSNIQQTGTKKRFSLINNVIPLLKEMLRDQSVLTIYKYKNGFATPIRPRLICPICHGLGKVGVGTCKACDGKGVVLNKDVTDEIIWPLSMDKDETVGAHSNVFTYMVPPLNIWDQYIKEEARNENKASDTLWGTHRERVEIKERTAFETFIDTQPVTITLSEISEVAEFMEWQFTEWLANYYDPTKVKNEVVSIISYGKTFIIEPPEALMERYRSNKAAGVSVVILNREFVEYLTSKYKNNPTALHKELIKMQLDYYLHYTIKEVYDVFGPVEAQKKMIFADWWETLDLNNVDTTDINKLRAERDTWVLAKIQSLGINAPIPE